MNRERAKELLPIIQAFAEGKTIQVKEADGSWGDLEKNPTFLSAADEYRIKPELREWWLDTDDGETWQQRHSPHPGCIKVREVIE